MNLVTIPLFGRRGEPDQPCRQHGGLSGCFTTGWQDTVEVAAAWYRRMQREPAFDKAVRRLFKQHASRLPRFFPSGYELESYDHGNNIYIVTHCSSGAPMWDMNRPGRYFHEQCNLYSLISNI